MDTPVHWVMCWPKHLFLSWVNGLEVEEQILLKRYRKKSVSLSYSTCHVLIFIFFFSFDIFLQWFLPMHFVQSLSLTLCSGKKI